MGIKLLAVGRNRSAPAADRQVEIPEVHHSRPLLPEPAEPLVVGVSADAAEAGVFDVKAGVVLFEIVEHLPAGWMCRRSEEAQDDIPPGGRIEVKIRIDRA